MPAPADPSIYHIVHVDRLASIVADGFLWCDAEAARRRSPGTVIGIPEIKAERLERPLDSRPGLRVGDCVPFHFCPRSVMLYVIHKKNHPNLAYRGGQELIVHLEADLRETVAWAEGEGRRWAFTLSNAAAGYSEDRCDLAQLNEIDWDAVRTRDWASCKDGKQAEFLIERSFPWMLVRRIGVRSQGTWRCASAAVQAGDHSPPVKIVRDWYYCEAGEQGR